MDLDAALHARWIAAVRSLRGERAGTGPRATSAVHSHTRQTLEFRWNFHCPPSGENRLSGNSGGQSSIRSLATERSLAFNKIKWLARAAKRTQKSVGRKSGGNALAGTHWDRNSVRILLPRSSGAARPSSVPAAARHQVRSALPPPRHPARRRTVCFWFPDCCANLPLT